jgi:hypothetical protein
MKTKIKKLSDEEKSEILKEIWNIRKRWGNRDNYRIEVYQSITPPYELSANSATSGMYSTTKDILLYVFYAPFSYKKYEIKNIIDKL